MGPESATRNHAHFARERRRPGSAPLLRHQHADRRGLVRQQVEPLARQTGGSMGPVVTQPMVDLLKHFGGSHNRLTGTLNDREFSDPTYFKGKSDVIASQLDTASVTALLAAVADAGLTDVICDAYGGAVADLADDATAFVHRSKTLFNMQYIVDWTSSSEAEQRRRLDSINRVYAALVTQELAPPISTIAISTSAKNFRLGLLGLECSSSPARQSDLRSNQSLPSSPKLTPA